VSSIAALLWKPVTGKNNASVNLLDTSVSTTYNISLNGSDSNGNRVKAKVVVIDNFGNNGTVSFAFGITSYSVAPYTRKSFYIQPEQQYGIFTASVGIVTLTFCDYDPQIPDDVNQVATNSASGGSSGSFTTLNPADIGPNINLAVNNLAAGSSASVHNTGRAKDFKLTGRFYFESYCGYSGGVIGIANAAQVLAATFPGGGGGNSIGVQAASPGFIFNGAGTGTTDAASAGDTSRWAVDLVNKRIWNGKIGTGKWNGSNLNDPATNVGGIDISSFVTGSGVTVAFDPFSGSVTYNFGASAFVGAIPQGFTGWTTN
jgi:hypothetical protein